MSRLRSRRAMMAMLLGEDLLSLIPTTPQEEIEDDVMSLVDKGLVVKVWEYRIPGGEPIYSSPVGPVTVYAGSGGIANQTPAVLFTAWDWYTYALDVYSGQLLWRRPHDNTCYGRVQAADVNGDGYNELFSPSHDGSIWSMESDGVLRWRFFNVYDREGSGTITGASTWSITDNTKSWAANAFVRSTTNHAINAHIRFLTGALAFVPGTEDPETGLAPTDIAISGNDGGDTLWTSTALSPVPAAGDQYVILQRYKSDNIFMHSGTLVSEQSGWFLYATCFDNHIYKIDADTGELVWKFATMENIEPYPVVHDGYVYAVSIDGYTRKLNAATGMLEWETATGQCDAFLNVDSESPNLVWVSSRDNRVYRLEGASGVLQQATTDTGAWDYGDIDSSALPVTLPNNAGRRILVGGDAGTIWCFDEYLETRWAAPVAPQALNSSPVVHNVTGKTGELAVGVADMRGTMHWIDIATGKSIGKLYVKGGIEGYPYYGDIDGDGYAELITTSTDGYVTCWRFNQGTVYQHADTVPGNTRWQGNQVAASVSPPPSMMAIQWSENNSATTHNVFVPYEAEAGQVALMLIYTNSPAVSAGPPGWQSVPGALSAGGRRITAFYKTLAAGDFGNKTFTTQSATPSLCVVVSGANINGATLPWDVSNEFNNASEIWFPDAVPWWSEQSLCVLSAFYDAGGGSLFESLLNDAYRIDRAGETLGAMVHLAVGTVQPPFSLGASYPQNPTSGLVSTYCLRGF